MIPEKIDTTNKREKYQFTAYIGHASSDMGLLGEYENAINIIIKDLKATKTRIEHSGTSSLIHDASFA